MHVAARHVLRAREPGEHGHGAELALLSGASEEHPRRLVANSQIDAGVAQITLDDLLDQLAHPVT